MSVFRTVKSSVLGAPSIPIAMVILTMAVFSVVELSEGVAVGKEDGEPHALAPRPELSPNPQLAQFVAPDAAWYFPGRH